MELPLMMISFVVLLAVITFVIAMILRHVMFSSADGAVRRLKEDIEKANALQAQLGLKLKTAEEELAKRQAEAKALAEKMKTDAETVSKSEREKIISKAREEGEEIIAKAQNAKQKVLEELEKENDIKMITYSTEILNNVLSQKAKGAFDDVLVGEFLDGLKAIDMSRISPDINTVDVITVNPLKDNYRSQLGSIIKEKMGRDLVLKPSVDQNLGGGMVIKFGSMALDGSMRNLIRESAVGIVQKVSSR